MEPKKPISHFVAGLIIAAILVIYSIILNFMNLSQNKGLGWLSYIILIGGLAFFVNQYGKAKDHQVTFGNLFSYGFKVFKVSSCINRFFYVNLVCKGIQIA